MNNVVVAKVQDGMVVVVSLGMPEGRTGFSRQISRHGTWDD